MKQVLNLMERVHSRKSSLVIEFIRDAFFDIESNFSENIVTSYIDIVADQSLYELPVDFVMNDSIEINKDIDDYNDFQWTIQGRKLKVLVNNRDGTYSAPDTAKANGIAVKHTATGNMFVKDPTGSDSSLYDYKSGGENGFALIGDIIYTEDGYYAGGERYSYYEAIVAFTGDLATVDYSDTDTWVNVSSIASPDEFSYINADENLIQAIISHVKSSLSMDSDPALAQNHMVNSRAKASQAVVVRKGRQNARVRPARRPYSLR